MDLLLSDYMRDVLRLPRQTMTSHVAQTAHPVHDEDDRRRQIIEGLHYSRSFIISYNLVLVALLLCFAILYWATKALGRQRTRKYARKQEDDIRVDGGQRALATYSSSSSSSTLGEPAVPLERTKEGSRKDERTPLLAAADGRNTGPTHARASILHTFRSWMMYQPGNIPIVNKVLPSNATSLGILLFLGLNAFYMFYRVPLTLLTTFVFADRTGLLFVANLPLLYLFAAKNQPIVLLTGYSYETLNIFHRRLGELMALLALVHSAGMVTVWYTILYPRIDLWHFLAIKMIWLGLLAFTSYEVLYLTSLSSFRQRFYELFLGLHIILQAAALILVWFHHEGSRPYVGIALGIFLIDRLIFRLGLKTRTVKADLTVLEDGETVLLSSDWQLATPPPWRKYFNLHIKSGWGATEHVFLSVPALAHKHKIQAHPFTIASAAPAPSSQHAWLNFIIRAHDGFSRDLLHYAQSHPAVDVRIDGPYGSPHALEMLHASDVAVLVAGGSGIAVAYPLLWSLLVDADRDSTSANGRRIPRQVCLVWVVHDALHLDWVGQDRLNELRGRGLKVIIPPATRKAGRPDVGKLVDDAIASFGHLDKPAVGVVVSGPDGLNRDCRNACARLVGQGVDVHVSIEKFGW